MIRARNFSMTFDIKVSSKKGLEALKSISSCINGGCCMTIPFFIKILLLPIDMMGQ